MQEETKICNQCGNEVEGYDVINTDNEHEIILCNECQDNGYIVCQKCGYISNDIDEYGKIHSDYFCIDCMHDKGYERCVDCGEWTDDYIVTEDTNEVYCDNCRESLFYCGECDNWYSNTTNYYITGYGDICENCYEAGEFDYCDNCECNYCTNDMIYTDEHGYVCEDCYNEIEHNTNGQILPYHGFNNWQEKIATNEKKQPKIFIGTELEVNSTSESQEILNYITTNIPVVLERDSSVNGFEIISQPMSIKYIKENESKFKKVFEYLTSQGYKSHDTNCCGLHIHVTRPSDEVIDRILFIMETYKNELIQFSRRANGNLNQWSQFLSDYSGKHEQMKSLEFLKQVKNENSGTRYMALNLCNNKTIEFRIFRGTLRFETYMASIELVYNLVSACMDLKKPLSEITWEYINRTKYAKKYIQERNIFTNIIPKDMTSELLRKFKKLQLAKNKFIKVIAKSIKDRQTKIANCSNLNITQKMENEEITKKINKWKNDYLYKLNDLNSFVSNCNNLINAIRQANNTNDLINLMNINLYIYDSETREKLEKLVNEITNGGEK